MTDDQSSVTVIQSLSKFSNVRTAGPGQSMSLSYNPISDARAKGVPTSIAASSFISSSTTDYQLPKTILFAFDSYASGAPAAA